MGFDSKPKIVDIVGMGLSGVGDRRGSSTALIMILSSSSGMCNGDKNCSERDRVASKLQKQSNRVAEGQNEIQYVHDIRFINHSKIWLRTLDHQTAGWESPSHH